METTAQPPEPDDPALQTVEFDLDPAQEVVDDIRQFQGIPGIERAANGRLWATWYGGGKGEGPENYCMLAASADDGRTWSPIKAVVDPPGNVRAFDPCLWHDPEGRLWFFWAQGYSHWDGRAGVWAVTTDDSEAANPSWSEPRRICDGIMMNKPTVLSTGEWLLPVAVWAFPARVMDEAYAHDISETTGSHVYCSTDQGRTWTLRGTSDLDERACDEHMLVERQDGSLWMLVRTKYGIGEAVSHDRGKTWDDLGRAGTVSHIPHARFFIRRLASGRLLFVRHEPPDGKSRSHMTASLSDDDGRSWYGKLIIEERSCSYPDGVQAPDGAIYIIYDRERRASKEIMLAKFTEEDVAAGKPVSEKARFRMLVNQAAAQPLLDLRGNAGGQPLLTGTGAEFTVTDGEPAQFVQGAVLFTNRGYTVAGAPEALADRHFARTSIDATHATCTAPGPACVVTPLPDRNKDTVVEALEEQGFQKAAVPEFLLFGDIEGNVCSVFQKEVKQGETVSFGKWGVLIY